MLQPASSFLSPWSAYYATIGAASATLIGLMFIVITLSAGSRRIRRYPEGIGTFSTPTVVHFGAALLIAAVMLVPWRDLHHTAVLLAIAGAGGVAFALRVMMNTKRLNSSSYVPDTEDWVWYNVLPLIAYGAILVGALTIPLLAGKALIAVAAGTLFLVFIGIHNSWDVVTYIVIIDPDNEGE